jgi:type I restriction enzyme R subunit
VEHPIGRFQRLRPHSFELPRNIEDLAGLRIQPFCRFGTPVEIVRRFGGKASFLDALRGLNRALYGEAPG